MNNFIIYELNEVPPRLFKKYIREKPKSNFAKIYKYGIFKETITKDDGELHPWSTWPSLHRGVPNSKHNIRYLNQDLKFANEKYPPLWVSLASSGIDVGVFGSLQSFPPIYGEKYKFYLPDTFAPNPESFPKEIENFQKFNLKLAGDNKAINLRYDYKTIFNFSQLIFKRTINFSSAIRAFIHVIKEIINPKYKKRRSLMQPILGFDVFWKHFLKYQPKVSTFFTNHVAGMMHRYWYATFPEDIGLNEKEVDKFNSESIFKAMDIADKQVGIISEYCDKNSSNLLIISSMGQEYIDWGEYKPEIFLSDSSKFIKMLGLSNKDYSLFPAMQPDIVFGCSSQKSLNKLINAIENLQDEDGNKLIKLKYSPSGLRANFSLGVQTDSLSKKAQIFNKETKLFNKIGDYGLKFFVRDKGTAYHVPEGILLAYGKSSKHFNFDNKKLVDICEIKPKILDLFTT